MISDAFCHCMAKCGRIQPWGEHLHGINLRNDIFEFKMGATKRKDSRKIPLGEDENAWFLRVFVHLSTVRSGGLAVLNQPQIQWCALIGATETKQIAKILMAVLGNSCIRRKR